MKYTIFSVIVLGLITSLLSCGNASYQRNEDGLVYKIFSDGKEEKIKPGTYLKLYFEAHIGDSVLFSSFGKIPSYGFFDTIKSPTHDFLDIITEMSVDDSAIVIRSVDTLVKRGYIRFNEVFKKGSVIKVFVKLLGNFKSQEESDADLVAETTKYKKSELIELEKFVKSTNSENVIKTSEGVFVDIKKSGSGILIDSGMTVKVKYTGKLINGTVFDSNVDTSFGHTDPLEFTIGARQVIEGWEIGVRKLNKGAKANIYIPSMLGYGSQGSPPKIPAFSNLVFDIEVLEAGFADSLSSK